MKGNKWKSKIYISYYIDTENYRESVTVYSSLTIIVDIGAHD